MLHYVLDYASFLLLLICSKNLVFLNRNLCLELKSVYCIVDDISEALVHLRTESHKIL